MSTFEDCQKFLNFIVECFVEKPVTVNQLKLEKLRTATAACCRITEAHPIKITDREEEEVNEKEKPKPSGASLRESGHGNACTLTNIYIYPIKSCAAFEVWWSPHRFSVTVYQIHTQQQSLRARESSYRPKKIVRRAVNVTTFWVVLMLCCSRRSITGLWDRTVYYMTEAGWWWTETVFASAKRESRVYVSFNLKSICLLTDCCCRHQVRSCFSSLLKNTPALALFQSGFWFFSFVSSVVPQEWMLFQFPLKTLPTCTQAMKCVRAKFVVTGALTSTQTSVGNTDSRHMAHVFSLSHPLAHSLAPSLSHANTLQHCVIVHLCCLQFVNEKQSNVQDLIEIASAAWRLTKEICYLALGLLEISRSIKLQISPELSSFLVLPPGWRLSTVGMRRHPGFQNSLDSHVVW